MARHDALQVARQFLYLKPHLVSPQDFWSSAKKRNECGGFSSDASSRADIECNALSEIALSFYKSLRRLLSLEIRRGRDKGARPRKQSAERAQFGNAKRKRVRAAVKITKLFGGHRENHAHLARPDFFEETKLRRVWLDAKRGEFFHGGDKDDEWLLWRLPPKRIESSYRPPVERARHDAQKRVGPNDRDAALPQNRDE